ncbi:MAG: hypothetical protein AABY18_01230 [Candidatus Thermoplasmatota archaeon]
MTGKRMNNRKGADAEREALRILAADGYFLDRTVRHVYRTRTGWGSHRNDTLGCIDIVAKKAGERTRWIQVHAGDNLAAKARKLAKVPWTLAHDSVELWQWAGNLQGTNPRTGQPKAGRFFRIYRLEDNFKQEHCRIDALDSTS